MVVVPEAVAVVQVVLHWGPWSRSRFGALLLVLALGSASLGGLWALAVDEASGASWRAATLRETLRVGQPPNGTGPSNITGTRVVYTETLLLVARTGYHPDLLFWLSIVFGVTYAVLFCVVPTVVAVNLWLKETAAARL